MKSSYTPDELEQDTGFGRRTIAYYVQEGLLPKVGRRGPRTRYPKQFRDRLLFIRRVREAEEAGQVAPMSLNDLRLLFEEISEALIAQVAHKLVPVTSDLTATAQSHPPSDSEPESADLQMRASLRGVTDRSTSEEQDSLNVVEGTAGDYLDVPHFLRKDAAQSGNPPVHRVSQQSESLGSWAYVKPNPNGMPSKTDLATLMNQVQEAARRSRGRTNSSMDRWCRIQISPDIALSVRGVSDDDAGLVEKVAERLRALITHSRGNSGNSRGQIS